MDFQAAARNRLSLNAGYAIMAGMERFENLPGGLRLKAGGFPLGSDTMALAGFVRLRSGDAVCDLGCGGGALGLLLCAAEPSCRVTGVELDATACAVAADNFAQPALKGRCTLIPGDLREIRSLLPAGSFSAAVSNPPYFPAGSPVSPEPARAAARSELGCSLDELCAAASWVLRNGGRFSLVYRAERLCGLVCALRRHGLEPKRLRPVRHRPGSPVRLLLLEARKGGGQGLTFEPDLLFYGPDGNPTAEYRRIYHEGGD